MTHKIPKSQLPYSSVDEFHAAVEAYIQELVIWTGHMARVREWDVYKADVLARPRNQSNVPAPIEHHKYPPPIAHPHIALAVNDKHVADYEIFDDGPTPEQILQQRKTELIALINAEEEEAIARVMPRTKQRLFFLRVDQVLRLEERTDADRALLVQAQSVRSQLSTIELTAATMMSEVEDLTLENLDGWKVRPL